MRTINPKHIEAVESALRSAKQPLTANALGRRLRCSRDTALRRLAALVKAKKGFLKVKKTYVREGDRGPESEAFGL